MIKDMLKRVYRFLVAIDSEEQVQTVPIEEYNKIKQALEQANARVLSLQKANQDIINKSEITLAETEYIESQVRSIQIENILSKINNITDQERNKLQQTLVNSDLSVEFIEDTYRRISKKNNINNNRIVETKLPQNSVPLKDNDFSYVT
jgi:hypothetical protein